MEGCVDCSRGQSLGCSTYCCRLIVRLTPEERERFYPNQANRISMDKGPSGYCEMLDLESGLCSVWEERPTTCRDFDCRHDPRIQHVIKTGEVNVIKIAQRVEAEQISQSDWVRI